MVKLLSSSKSTDNQGTLSFWLEKIEAITTNKYPIHSFIISYNLGETFDYSGNYDFGKILLRANKYFGDQFDEHGNTVPVSLEDITSLQTQFENEKKELESLLIQIKDCSEISNIKKFFIVNNLNRKIAEVDLLKDHIVFIEGEKGGLKLSDSERNIHLEAIKKAFHDFYGATINESPEKIKNICEYLQSLIAKYEKQEQKREEKDYGIEKPDISLLKSFVNKYHTSIPDVEVEDELEETEEKSKKIGQIEMGNMFHEIFGILDRKSYFIRYSDISVPTLDQEKQEYTFPISWRNCLESDTDANWIAKKTYLDGEIEKGHIGPDTILIDLGTKPNASIDVRKQYIYLHVPQKEYYFQKICKLIDHEIITHITRGGNSRNLLDYKHGDYSIGEEGVAKLNDKMIANKGGEINSDPSLSTIKLFFAENNDIYGTINLLRAYHLLKRRTAKKKQTSESMKSINKKVFDTALRAKRFGDFTSEENCVVNQKDMIYEEGSGIVQDFINNNAIDSKTKHEIAQVFYLCRGSAEELLDPQTRQNLIDILLEEKGENKGIKDNVKTPIFIGKLLYQIVNFLKERNVDISQENTPLNKEIVEHLQRVTQRDIRAHITHTTPQKKEDPTSAMNQFLKFQTLSPQQLYALIKMAKRYYQDYSQKDQSTDIPTL